MDLSTLEQKKIQETKEVIEEWTRSLSKEVMSIRKSCELNFINDLDNLLNGDWGYYENMLFDEYTFKQRVLDRTGYFDYGELCSEIDEYIRLHVWYRAYMRHMDGEL